MNTFDYSLSDVQAMPVTPVAPADFDFGRYQAYASAADQRYAAFLQKKEGVAVWQRVRVSEVFSDGCKDMQQSLHWQLGGLTKSMSYSTDAPAYLEPWYGIGVTASAFGSDYAWPVGQAPVVKPMYQSLADFPDLLSHDFKKVPIMKHILAMIEYFLEETKGRLPLSWTDIQNPLNVATELMDINNFFLALVDEPDKVQGLLAAIADVVINFSQEQTVLISDALAKPGHGFASSRTGYGIGMSCDNLLMISPRMYETLSIPVDARIGAHFGGTAIHSCGNWARWAPTVKKIENLVMVDGAFTPKTDPDYNQCETFRDVFVNSNVVVQARMVGDPDEVLEYVQRIWAPGMKLIVVTYVQDVQAQHQLYLDIHQLCK
jgi:hypothetical protein